MTEIQKRILDIFEQFKNICDDNNLTYFAIGGTCIGAVRHKGFIPWDDDLDVAMPFEDYIKFRAICKYKLPNHLELFDYNNIQHFRYTFLKLHDSSTTCIENENVVLKDRITGIFIDIMPVSKLPNNYFLRTIIKYRFTLLNILNRNERYSFKEKTSAKGKMSSLIFQAFCHRKNYQYYSDKIEKLLLKYSKINSNFTFFPWRVPDEKGYKAVFPSEIFNNLKLVSFENSQIFIPGDYDKYLKMDFGDYMKLPPEEKRVGCHYKYVSFHSSYKEYIERLSL